MQISDLAQTVIKEFQEGRCCLDIVGRGNVLVLTQPDGASSLKVVDLGMFDLTRIPGEAPERYAQLVKSIEKLRSWLSLCDEASQGIDPSDTRDTSQSPQGNPRPFVGQVN